ncbi:MAG: hypothetical protein AUK44_10765 [Porphyromonadaceae bacterium CG2_30_38_12]|nr:MAG: hypothetical protein AUK44_10765 [Porphyromonadaceae bacterium CG2_30_38_12]
MNLFWKKLFGKITPTSVLEKQDEEVVSAMKRYEEVSKSKELAEYNLLFKEVKSAAFIENKKTLQSRKYKDTEEYKVLKRYHKLHHSHGIKMYFEMLQSAQLEKFLTFKATPDYIQLGDKKAVKESQKLQEFKAFERSKNYKIYCRFHNSFILKEYDELKKQVGSDTFKTQNSFWENANRWQTVPEYKKEQRFYELDKNPDIQFYINEKPERFEAYKKLQITFEERFDWNTLNKSAWDFGFHYKNPKTIRNHSFANEKQANNDGKNVTVINGILNISTKKETLTARAWDQTKGFLMKEFEYSSDVLNTATEFRQQGGTFMAKIRCSGNVHHAFWLGANGKLPHINIFHFDGHKISVGNAYQNIIDGTTIRGINPTEFYIYSLIWSKNELVWMLNNMVVYRTSANIPQEAMYLVFNSFIPKKAHGSEGKLEVDWVRVYKN